MKELNVNSELESIFPPLPSEVYAALEAQDTCKVSHRVLMRSSVFLGLLNKRAANFGILLILHPSLAANVLMILSA